MSGEDYQIIGLRPEERERLERVFDDLWSLSESPIPSVRSAARAALAHIAQAMNGEGIAYRLYTQQLTD